MSRVAIAGLALVGPLLAAWMPSCGRTGNQYVPPPPPEVTVARPIERTVPDALVFTGVTRGLETVEVRARVKGFIQAKHVRDGQRVRAGDLLFTIDPREFEATVRQAEAEVATRLATLKLAELQLDRTRDLFHRQVETQLKLDTDTAERDRAAAQLALARAQLENAQLDLTFTEVRALIDGRLSLRTIDVGQLVGMNEATLLGSIINDSQVYATYSIDERKLLELRDESRQKSPGEDGRPELEVRLALLSDDGFPHIGRFAQADNRVDPNTGSMLVEAIFPNPEGRILPGLFVRIQFIRSEQRRILVPDVAVQNDQNGKFVMVVDEKNMAERRDVRVGQLVDRLRVVEDGLEPGAWVVINGVQRARPGAAVTPKRVELPLPAATASAPAITRR